MAELVNATHKERLSQRNSEPSHLKGGSYDDLGGTGIDSEPNSVKIDAGKGVKGQDTSIIGAGQNSEKSHLNKGGTLDEKEDDVEVSFDGDKDDDVDDIDKELDQFEDVEPVDVDVDMDGDDTDDEKKKEVKEERKWATRLKEDDERGEAEADMDKDMKEPEAAMNSGKNKVTEDELPPWLQKKGEKDGDKDDDKEVDEAAGNFGGKKAKPFGKKGVNEDEIIIKKGDGEESGEEKKVEKDEKEPEEVMDKKVEESVKIRIHRPDVKLFESAGLSATAQKKVSVIFESVVKDVTKQVANQMAAFYKKLHESKLRQRDAILAKQIDAYMNYVTEEWVKNNRVGIRTALRSQLAEEFLSGFQKLMKEHYIDVPESKVDVVKELSQQVTRLKKSLNEQTSAKLKMRRIAEAANKGRHVAEFTKTAKLSEAQAAKLNKLAEDVPYTSAKEFREKLTMLAESYFGGGEKKKLKVLPEEKIQLQEETGSKKTVGTDPDVAIIASVLKRQADLLR